MYIVLLVQDLNSSTFYLALDPSFSRHASLSKINKRTLKSEKVYEVMFFGM